LQREIKKHFERRALGERVKAETLGSGHWGLLTRIRKKKGSGAINQKHPLTKSHLKSRNGGKSLTKNARKNSIYKRSAKTGANGGFR